MKRGIRQLIGGYFKKNSTGHCALHALQMLVKTPTSLRQLGGQAVMPATALEHAYAHVVPQNGQRDG